MATQYNDSSVLYNSPITTYNGKKKYKETYSVTLSLSGALDKKAGKLLDASLVNLTAQQYKDVDGIASVSLNLSATYTRLLRLRRMYSAEIILGGEALKSIGKFLTSTAVLSANATSHLQRNRTLSASVGTSANREIFIKKLSGTTVTISTDQTKNIDGTAEVSTTLSASVSKRRFIRRTFNSEISLLSDVSKRVGKYAQGSITMSTDQGTQKFGVGNVTINLGASVDAISYKTETLNASASLSSSITIFVKKVSDVTITLSSNETKQVYGVANVSINLGASKSKRISKELSASMTLSASNDRTRGFSFNSTFSLSGSITKKIDTINDVNIGLVSEVEVSKGKIIDVSLSLGASRAIFIKREDGVTIGLEANGGKRIDGTTNVSVGMSAGESKGVNKYLDSPIGVLASNNKDIATNLAASLSITDDVSKRAAKDLSTSVGLTASIDKSPRRQYSGEVTVSLTTEKSIFVKKNNGVIIQIEGQENKFIEGSVLVSITPTVDPEKKVLKGLDATSSLSSEIASRQGRTLNASLATTSDKQRKTSKLANAEVSLIPSIITPGPTPESYTGEVTITLGASKSVFIKKSKGVTISFASGANREIDAIAEVSIGLSASFSASSDKEEILNTSLSLGASKSIFVKKESGATITMAGSDTKYIEGSVNVGIGLTASVSTSSDKEETLSTSLTLGASKSIFVKKTGVVVITMEGSDTKYIEGTANAGIGLTVSISTSSDKEETLSTSITLGASRSIFVKKENGSTITMTGSGTRYIEGIAEVSIGLSPEISLVRGRVLNSSLTLGASRSILVKKANGVTITMTGADTRSIDGVANVTIGLTPSITVDATLERTLSTSLSLGASATILIKKERGASISMTGGDRRDISGVAEAGIVLSASFSSNEEIKEILSTSLTLGASKTIFVKKSKGVTIAITGTGSRFISGEASVSIGLVTEYELVRGRVLDSSLTLGASRAVFVKKSNGATITFTASDTKQIEGIANASLGLSASVSTNSNIKETFSTSFALGASKSIFVRKENGATITMTGADVRRIDGVANASLGLSASITVDSSLERTFSTSLQLGVSKSIFVKKASGATITMAGSGVRYIEGSANVSIGLSTSLEAVRGRILDSSFSLGASRVIFVRKSTGATITFEGGQGKDITAEASVSVTLTPSIDAGTDKTELLEVSTTLGAEMTILVRKVFTVNVQMSGTDTPGGKYNPVTWLTASAFVFIKKSFEAAAVLIGSEGADIEGTGNVTINMAVDTKKRINKGLSASFSISGTRSQSAEATIDTSLSLTPNIDFSVNKETGAIIELNSDKTMRVLKTINTPITLTAYSSGSNELALAVGMTLGASVDIVLNPSGITVNIGLQQDTAKRIGKTFTIREHSQSVYHDCK